MEDRTLGRPIVAQGSLSGLMAFQIDLGRPIVAQGSLSAVAFFSAAASASASSARAAALGGGEVLDGMRGEASRRPDRADR